MSFAIANKLIAPNTKGHRLRDIPTSKSNSNLE
jgi:hypothetical protein